MKMLERETLMNRWMRRAFLFIFIFQLFSLSTLPPFSDAQAQTAIQTEIQVGRSQIISVKKPISKISVASQEIADVDVMSPTQVIVFGKSAGNTNLVILDEAGQVGIRDLHRLVQVAQERGVRLVLSGDSRQHGAVEPRSHLEPGRDEWLQVSI